MFAEAKKVIRKAGATFPRRIPVSIAWGLAFSQRLKKSS
jgi:hypothetical protein